MDPEFIRQAVIFYLMLLIGFTVHEWAHAFVADKLGDPTARLMGRVTLNPLAHMTLMGSVVLPLIAIFAFNGFIAAGKPVPVNTSNFHPKERARKHILLTLAGPLSNLGLAFVAFLLAGIASHFSPPATGLLIFFAQINIWLFVFNMIPIPPLDGSHLLRYAVNMSEETFYKFSMYGFWIFLAIILFVPGVSSVLAFIVSIVQIPLSLIFNLIAAVGI